MLYFQAQQVSQERVLISNKLFRTQPIQWLVCIAYSTQSWVFPTPPKTSKTSFQAPCSLTLPRMCMLLVWCTSSVLLQDLTCFSQAWWLCHSFMTLVWESMFLGPSFLRTSNREKLTWSSKSTKLCLKSTTTDFHKSLSREMWPRRCSPRDGNSTYLMWLANWTNN